MTNLPPPRPGYHRDADPEGRWADDDGDRYSEQIEAELVTEYNLPALVVTWLIFLSVIFAIPLNIILWKAAL